MSIKLKQKPCKGTGKAKGHGCKTIVYAFRYGLCQKCFQSWLLNTPEGQIVLDKSQIRGKKKFDIDQRIERRKEKEALIPPYEKLQRKIQEIVRLIDKGQLCLARNIRGRMQGGHIYAKGGNSQMRYNLHNIHRQSAHSNKYKNDDGLLREGIIYEYGQPYMDFISSLKQTPSPKYSNIEYGEFHLRACEIALRLKKEDLWYSKEDRIKLRNEINIELGIYDEIYLLFK